MHPELGIGVETVASRPMDGRAETREVILENGKHLRVLSVEDVIADRVGQSYMLGKFPPGTANEFSRLEQAAAIWYAFHDKLDMIRLNRRLLEETGDVDLHRFQAWLGTRSAG